MFVDVYNRVTLPGKEQAITDQCMSELIVLLKDECPRVRANAAGAIMRYGDAKLVLIYIWECLKETSFLLHLCQQHYILIVRPNYVLSD